MKKKELNESKLKRVSGGTKVSLGFTCPDCFYGPQREIVEAKIQGYKGNYICCHCGKDFKYSEWKKCI